MRGTTLPGSAASGSGTAAGRAMVSVTGAPRKLPWPARAGAGAGAGTLMAGMPWPAAEVSLPGLAAPYEAPFDPLLPNDALLYEVLPESLAASPDRPVRFSLRPAAMTVTRTSLPRASSMTAPKMMFASTAAELDTS